MLSWKSRMWKPPGNSQIGSIRKTSIRFWMLLQNAIVRFLKHSASATYGRSSRLSVRQTGEIHHFGVSVIQSARQVCQSQHLPQHQSCGKGAADHGRDTADFPPQPDRHQQGAPGHDERARFVPVVFQPDVRPGRPGA